MGIRSRADSFHLGQVWESPRGMLYKVVSFMGSHHPKVAVLRKGSDGAGRKYLRAWDGVEGWVLHSDEDEK